MAILYVKNKYTPIVLITLAITLAYLILVLYYIQVVDNNSVEKFGSEKLN